MNGTCVYALPRTDAELPFSHRSMIVAYTCLKSVCHMRFRPPSSMPASSGGTRPNTWPPPASPTGARFFHVRIGGFDTHTNQGALTGRQADLLAQVSSAIKAFYDDMVALGVANKVLIMTFSEFGRRVAENGSPSTAGTDHGAAAPLFVVGNGITTAPGGGYVFGRVPPLDTGLLENGRNLAYHTDFRRVYATVIDDWLNGDSAAVLGGAFASVGFVA